MKNMTAAARLALLAVFLSIPVLSTGCSAQKEYVSADAQTYVLIAPYAQAGIDADTVLTPEEKARKLRTIETWRFRIEQNGGKVK